MKTVKFAAIHYGGGYDRSVMTVAMDLDDNTDPETAIETAVSRYLRTEEMKKTTNGYFSYGDFIEQVPEDILSECGIHAIRTETYETVVNQDTNLAPPFLYVD